jgi:hypothetical protein
VRGRTVTAGEQQVPPGGLLHPAEQELHEVAPWRGATAPSLQGMQLALPAWSSNELYEPGRHLKKKKRRHNKRNKIKT